MSSKTINFFKGHPTSDLLPSLEILEATTNVLKAADAEPFKYDNDTENRSPLQYGSDLGNLDIRQIIANWINIGFNINNTNYQVKPEYLNLTAGASYGIMNALAQTTSPHNDITRQAFIITPTYYLINGSFIDAGFGGKLTAIDEFDNGQLDLNLLESKLKYFDSLKPIEKITKLELESINDPNRIFKKIYRYVIYIIPSFSNPKGGSLNKENRLKLIELARKYDMLIISDDVYELLDYTVPYDIKPSPTQRFTMLDRQTLSKENKLQNYGNTLSNGTFSKLICPGLRTGWQETATDKLSFQLSQGGSNKSGGTPAQLNTFIVAELIKSGLLDKIISNLRMTYSERSTIIKKAIIKYLPKGTMINGGSGGYFLWVTLPDSYDCRKIVTKCKERNVILANGDNFEVTGDHRNWGASSVRLSISYLTKEDIEEGIKIWGEVCREYSL
ncbi:hypothetical protein PACTADRAFT_49065 [Pachysolen tannophilus NRRL Y-2460]|uniref:Aminotransferase class I/classII large domain-containing protein n=1 Tax=Pachysolen tannophilus NRRL Y-2460 TaxID=669874 RepID=A0A1E4TZY6_PACTA|nr:hypothetical protein PACTADRAFT_49065 [Pachysolen tannophilus NRRL Y-2460]